MGVQPHPIPAGAGRARIPRYFALAYLGATLGEKSGAWIESHLWQFGIVAAFLFAALFLSTYLLGRSRTE